MKVNVLTITLLSSLLTTQITTASEIDFDLYTDKCVELYNSNVEEFGKSDINGTYLRYEGKENLKYNSLYFLPDANVGVRINGSKFSPTYDLSFSDDTYTFYSKKDNAAARSGLMYKLKVVSDDEYSVSIFKRSGTEKINGKITAKFEKPRKLNKSKKEPIFEAIFKVDEEQGKALNILNTQFPKTCLK